MAPRNIAILPIIALVLEWQVVVTYHYCSDTGLTVG
jgi:hypothetical protein